MALRHSQGEKQGRSAYVRPAENDASRRYPSTCVHTNRSSYESHVALMVVASRREKRFLGYHHIVSHEYVVLIVKPDPLADPRVLANMEFPRKLDSGTRTENHAALYIRSEQAQYKNS